MSRAPTPQENDLLVPFEQQNIPGEYRNYYQVKRGNFFASIQRFSEMWKYYMTLDQIWVREFGDLKPVRDSERMFPMMLYINAHAKIRVSIELAFSGCMAEARSILRDAIEFAAHAHAMLENPELQKVWLSKNEEQKAFEQAFEKNKKKGLDELHKVWGQLSEMGSHATLNAMCDRFRTVTEDDRIEFHLIYTGLDETLWATCLFWLLLADFKMEETMFLDYQTRLQFDEGLVQMRSQFARYKEQLREALKIRYHVEPPDLSKVNLAW